MRTYELIVIGTGAAGSAAALAFRQAGGTGPVVMVSADDRPPYDRPPLSKDYLRGEIGDDEITMHSASYYRDNGVDLMLSTSLQDIDPDRHALILGNATELAYTSCVLATGGAPATPSFAGASHPDVFQLRSARSARALREAATSARTAIVIGSGFIGCEAAASLALRGIDVTIVSPEHHPQQQRLGDYAAKRITQWLATMNVTFRGDTSVRSIHDGHRVQFDDGSAQTADLVLVATGNAPQGQLAQSAGLVVEDGRVVTDEAMRTSAPGLFAAGDVVLAFNAAAQRRIKVEHWGDADRMGQIAGGTAAGDDGSWAQVPGFWTQTGHHTLKYAAWGDGYDDTIVIEGADGAFTIWYGTEGVVVGVLTYKTDADYERGTELIAVRAKFADLRS